jgi:hypothetical protein
MLPGIRQIWNTIWANAGAQFLQRPVNRVLGQTDTANYYKATV